MLKLFGYSFEIDCFLPSDDYFIVSGYLRKGRKRVAAVFGRTSSKYFISDYKISPFASEEDFAEIVSDIRASYQKVLDDILPNPVVFLIEDLIRLENAQIKFKKTAKKYGVRGAKMVVYSAMSQVYCMNMVQALFEDHVIKDIKELKKKKRGVYKLLGTYPLDKVDVAVA